LDDTPRRNLLLFNLSNLGDKYDLFDNPDDFYLL